ncbi:hypothetical protein GCM10010156_72950 [Planobispora rosea]|uniref:Mobilization protein n=1 Tax=Planobispora rosea TaxID=35762 RepID=A0A8J3WGY1_PLARO|nr:hypothetical protein [Planobispora rosea]GGT04558.1 hypothetical protein GCM10010156_72950 [Planobispora rosea]GIH88893.1 hypothetical protein Pro02_73010 [Planobispora rosea]
MTDASTAAESAPPRRRRSRVPGGRSARVAVRLTAAEQSQFQAAAAAAAMTVPQLLVDTTLSALAPRPHRLPPAARQALVRELAAVRRQLRALGDAVCQLTLAPGSAAMAAPSQAQAVLQAVRHTSEQLGTTLRRLDSGAAVRSTR